MKVLIVDDKSENVYMLETLLKGKGYEVVSASNGVEALEKLRAEDFDMIIADILMPVMDGFRFCMEVKGDEKLKHIPFVFYTATYTDEKDEELALKMGADRFIRKPVDPDELIKIVQGLIRDVEKGKVRPKKPGLEGEQEVFKLYSERLVKKLEKKMLDLESEIIERKRAQEQIEVSLREKEVLLREIHHRVKNNLQIISSLLDLTSMRTDNQHAIDLLSGACTKIHTMSFIHMQLYQSERLDQIETESYIHRLVEYLWQLYAPKKGLITPVIRPSDVCLSVTQAIPCALVLNELISNALKHAFAEGQKGRIEISVKRLANDMIFVNVKDDGIGIPEEIDFDKVNTLGLKLVRNLVEQQLMGKIEVERIQGTSISITFKVLKEELRYAQINGC